MICAAALPAALCLLTHPAGHVGDGEIKWYLLFAFPDRLVSLTWLGFSVETVLMLFVTMRLIETGTGHVDPRMRPPLIAALLLCLVLPVSLFGGWGLHVRYPAMVAALLFASLELEVSRRAALAVLAVTVCAMAVNSASLTWYWSSPDRQIREMRAALGTLAPGTKLLVALDQDSKHREVDYLHSAEYAVMDREIFNPMVFTQKAQHIIHLRPEWEPIAAATSDQSEMAPLPDLQPLADGAQGRPDLLELFPYLIGWPCHFDNLLLFRITGQHEPVPPGLTRISAGTIFTLYRIDRPARCAKR